MHTHQVLPGAGAQGHHMSSLDLVETWWDLCGTHGAVNTSWILGWYPVLTTRNASISYDLPSFDTNSEHDRWSHGKV